MPSRSSLVRVLLASSLAVIVNASPLEPSRADALSGMSLAHLPVKRATDCGTWTMFCGGLPPKDGSTQRGAPAEGACNNACFYMNFINRDFVASYDSSADNDHSRVQSGCETRDGSVCNKMPFSQRFHDDFEQEPGGNQEYNCDEFPMAGMAQDDFSPDGPPRNSLRCIDRHENSAGGAQLKNFIDGVGRGLDGRTCDGPLPDGATFKIAFNYDGADQSKLGFCHLDSSVATLDIWHQFYLTQLAGGQSGRIDYPYDPDTSNRYAVASTAEDVLQCKLRVVRTSDETYEGWVYNNAGEEKGHASAQLAGDQQRLDIAGNDGVLDTAVVRLREMTDGPTNKGSNFLVYYGLGEQYGRFFVFGAWSGGNDNALRAEDPDNTVIDGAYCTLSDIEWSATTGARQEIECLFPCAA